MMDLEEVRRAGLEIFETVSTRGKTQMPGVERHQIP